MPDIDTGEQGTCTVYAVSLQLDANHDGVMDTSFDGADATSQSNPMKFWVNNGHCQPATASDPDRDYPVPPDSLGFANDSAGRITCPRDLENFARLWICGLPALTNNYQVTLSWNVTSGNPAINLYDSVEADGGTGYLTDTNIAAEQSLAYPNGVPGDVYYTGPGGPIDPTPIAQNAPFTFPANYFTNSGNKYFLFEGAGIGAGELTMTITDHNGNTVAQTGAWLDLQDVSAMFEHAHIANVTNVPPGNPFNPSTYAEDNLLPPDPTEDKNLILFVHGWRMGMVDYQNFSDTMFKRLYWQGYHGRFAALRWPTLSADDYWLPLLDYTTYNSSEFIAWRSGAGVSSYLTHLKQRFPNYNLNVCAHSMGNVVMASALKAQLAAGQTNVHNYVLMQAAVPASCYDTSFTNYAPFLDAEASQPTPNTYQGYPGAINAAVSGNLVDFYNVNDYALATGVEYLFGAIPQAVNWEANQENYKPDELLGYRTDGTHCQNGYDVIADPREIMAFCARPRAKAVGAQAGVGGVIHGSSVDLFASFGFNQASDEHSAQFNWDIQRVTGFYHQLLNALIPPTE